MTRYRIILWIVITTVSRLMANEYDTKIIFFPVEEIRAVKIGDFNSKGGIDLIAVYKDTETRDYKFMIAMDYDLADNHWESIENYDFKYKQIAIDKIEVYSDKKGKLEIFLISSSSPQVFSTIQQYSYDINTGKFEFRTRINLPLMVRQFMLNDWNKDGLIDFCLVGEVLESAGRKLFYKDHTVEYRRGYVYQNYIGVFYGDEEFRYERASYHFTARRPLSVRILNLDNKGEEEIILVSKDDNWIEVYKVIGQEMIKRFSFPIRIFRTHEGKSLPLWGEELELNFINNFYDQHLFLKSSKEVIIIVGMYSKGEARQYYMVMKGERNNQMISNWFGKMGVDEFFSIQGKPEMTFSEDINGDGINDLLVLLKSKQLENKDSISKKVYMRLGSLRKRAKDCYLNLPDNSYYIQDLDDITGDGRADLIIVDWVNRKIILYDALYRFFRGEYEREYKK